MVEDTTASRAAVNALLADLARMPAQLDDAFSLWPTDALRWKPQTWGGCPGETFSAAEHACHVRDIEMDGYHVRFQRLLDEDGAALVSLDGYAMASDRGYDTADPHAALTAFAAGRRRTIDLLRVLGDTQWDRTGTFAEYGVVSVRGLAHILRSHDLQHLACLEWLAGMRASAL